MKPLTLHRRLSLWLTLVALLMGALAPSLSQAMRAQGPQSWADVCSTAAPADGHEPAPGDAAHPFEHCPYCSLHHPTLGLPPSPLRLSLPDDLRHEQPLLFLSGPSGQHNWTAASPRGPPALRS